MTNLSNLIDVIYKSFSLEDIYKNPLFLVDIFIVLLLFYVVYRIFKNTRAEMISYGMTFLGAMFFISYFLNLFLVQRLLGLAFVTSIVAIPVVFQPELRIALERLGRTGIRSIKVGSDQDTNYISVIVDAVSFLSKNKIGAIVVMAKNTGLKEYISSGILIDGEVTKELLVASFITESPLHDGAVIISNRRIASASSILPLSESDTVFMLGTRHRAAMGLSEVSDASVIVVSEKTGEISTAFSGEFVKNITIQQLVKFLNKNTFQKDGKNS